MKRTLSNLLLLVSLFAQPARGANNSVNEACKRLCETESECVRKCVAHAELFELKSDLIDNVADWTPVVETRMKVLRTGANNEILALCKQTGWSLDNMLTCLRSYPTKEVIRECKKLSSLQEEQVRCIRLGKTSAEIEACSLLVPASNQRLECLSRTITAQETRECRKYGMNSQQRMNCLERAQQADSGETRDSGPAPASVKSQLKQ